MSEVPLYVYIEVQGPVHVQNPLGVRTLNSGTQTRAIGDVLVFIKFKIRTKLGRCAVIIFFVNRLISLPRDLPSTILSALPCAPAVHAQCGNTLLIFQKRRQK